MIDQSVIFHGLQRMDRRCVAQQGEASEASEASKTRQASFGRCG
jgi:hypothetical protein